MHDVYHDQDWLNYGEGIIIFCVYRYVSKPNVCGGFFLVSKDNSKIKLTVTFFWKEIPIVKSLKNYIFTLL